MDNTRLNEIFKSVHKKRFPGKMRRIDAQFYPYRSPRHTVQWNGRDVHGREVSSGTYIVRMEAGATVVSRKAALVR